MKLFVAGGRCQFGNWWSSFDRTGWSNCPARTPYIKGLYRNNAPHPKHDLIYRLEGARCCDAGKQNAQCLHANWVHSFDR